jgi:hypothetical protein
MISEKITPLGIVSFTLTDEFGNIKETQDSNLILSAGRAFVANRLLPTPTAPAISHIGVGTGGIAPSPDDAALGNQLDARAVLTSTTLTTTNVTLDSIQYIASFGPGVATGALTEAGLFTGATGGILVARTVFGVITKGPNDTLSVTWQIIIT